MKTISLLIFTVIASLIVVVVSQTITFDRLLYYFPCEHPVFYRLGEVDPRFQLTRDEAQLAIIQATSIWNTQYQKPLFEEATDSKLTVNFVFDQRQGLINQINTIEDKTSFDKTTLDARIAQFNQKAANFESRVKALNAQIDSWNKKGGAPPDVYSQLASQQQDLVSESQQLQTEANSLNQSTGNFNLQVSQLNNSIDNFNSLLSQKPEEGIYDGKNNRIDVYFNNSRNELIHTLTHEFGHSLGVGHVENNKSIMYTFTSESTNLTTQDVTELEKACQKINKFGFLSQKITKFLSIWTVQKP